ncbi:MAG: terminase family protein [Candidatus Binatus sp.]|jgi:hypothetical protein|uniref:terminase large subunit domain-containing protein n=1 Tax=Candidatus Binatus sp. TaxID=2811406 RepID=UPI003CB3351D
MANQTARDLRFSLDTPAFFHACTGFDPDPWQIQVLESVSPKLALNISRQGGKTTVCSAVALHAALYDSPGENVVLLAPSLRQSSEAMRAITGMYRNLSGESVEPVVAESALRLEFKNRSRIIAMPGAGDATVRGPNAKLILCDEASRVSEELIKACRPFLATKVGGRLLAISTPWFQRGWWHDAWINTDDTSWERIKVTAYECSRIDPKWLESERAEIGEVAFRSEYLCEFLDESAAMFPDALIRAAFDPNLRPLWS